ncbi:MAG: lipid A biosynthesis acyltransferase [Rubrivivax sp.]|nr:lipid A biosynthesis acyltransferase [Rubrivivax sp.]
MTQWTHKAERGSAWLIRLIAWLARVVGRPLCRGLLYPIVLYFVLTDATARRASAEFLQRARGRPTRLRDVFAHLYSFAATLLDRVYMAAGDFHRFDVSIVGLPLLDEALQAGRGCVLLGSHLGSFDLLSLAHRALDGRPVAVMMRVDPRSQVRRIAGIDDGSLNIIPLGRPDSFLRAHDALSQGSVVALLADRVDGAARRPVQFFGHATAMPTAPHVLAARSEAPVLMCFGLYEGGRRYRIEFIEFGPAAAPTSRGPALQPVVDRYAALLEAQARSRPLNWFNFYPYWSSSDDGQH